MSLGVGGGGSSSENNPWAPAIGDLERILGEAGNWFDSQGGLGASSPDRDTGYLGDAQDWYSSIMGGGQDITADQITGIADDLWNEELAQSMRDQSITDINSAMAGQDVLASQTGGMGSSRTALAQGAASSDITNQLNQDLMGMRQDNLGTAVGVAGGNRDAILSAGQGLLGAGRELSELDWLNAVDQGNAGINNLERYLQIISSIGGMGGSSSGNSTDWNMGFGGSVS
ncbi:hypothetical protein VCRA2123O443_220023 [Vibrio crassostreae]|nr:hypothetical protein VCRA2110O182_220032 [Vibrio crassostreae]CAK2309638.1 hypothetical protein VCRA2111O408_220034 [Vibrio crassostreae]CAK2326146.1 hypothetical protein VCRA211O406_220022 [Vibrio crassostreae]CAK3239201.1 hypothetical protein VCRA2123O443_220023 [Vibrio crassostreae]